MKVLFLGGTNSRNAGGVFNSARQLGKNLRSNFDVDVEFLMHSDRYSAEDKVQYKPAPISDYKMIGPARFGFSPDLGRILDLKAPDIIHTQTLWMFLSHATYKYHCRTRTPYVVSPRGMLDSWQLNKSRFRKKLALLVYENAYLRQAACFSALCESEYRSIRDLGLRNPIAIIPNGVDIEVDLPVGGRPLSTDNGRPQLLFLSRIDPKKGLRELLQAWAMAGPAAKRWRLTIAGDARDLSYLRQLEDLTRTLGLGESVEFIGGVYGNEKGKLFANSDAFILPSFSEGLPMAVLEAWSYGLPCLITPQCNLPAAFAHDAALRINPNPADIAEGLRRLFETDENRLREIGENGFRLARAEFSWISAARRTKQLYDWLLGLGERPDFVMTE